MIMVDVDNGTMAKSGVSDITTLWNLFSPSPQSPLSIYTAGILNLVVGGVMVPAYRDGTVSQLEKGHQMYRRQLNPRHSATTAKVWSLVRTPGGEAPLSIPQNAESNEIPNPTKNERSLHWRGPHCHLRDLGIAGGLNGRY